MILNLTHAVTLLVLVVHVPSSAVQVPCAHPPRIQIQSQESMTQGDHQGATIKIGRDALLAAQTSKQDATRAPENSFLHHGRHNFS